MKRLAILIFSLMILGVTFSVEASKKTVVVFPFEMVSDYNKANVDEIMSGEIILALQNSGRYLVIEREKMVAILEEQGFQNLTSDPNSAVEIGKLTGADYSLFGKVNMVKVDRNSVSKLFGGVAPTFKTLMVKPYKAQIEINIRFVDNETGELVFAKSFTGDKKAHTLEEVLNKTCKKVAENFLNELTSNLTGSIVDISDEECYIDQGLENGVRIGDIFLVFRETSPIQIKGKVVGMKTIPVGKIKVVEVNEEYSICKIVSVNSGMVIKKGDVVKKDKERGLL